MAAISGASGSPNHALREQQVRMGMCSMELTEYVCALTSANMASAERALLQLELSVEAAHVQPLPRALEMVAAGRALAEGRQRISPAASSVSPCRQNLSGGLGMSAMYYRATALDALPAEALGGLCRPASGRVLEACDSEDDVVRIANDSCGVVRRCTAQP